MKYKEKENIKKANEICADITGIEERYSGIDRILLDEKVKDISCDLSFEPNIIFPSIGSNVSYSISKKMIIKGYKLLLGSIKKDLEDELEEL